MSRSMVLVMRDMDHPCAAIGLNPSLDPNSSICSAPWRGKAPTRQRCSSPVSLATNVEPFSNGSYYRLHDHHRGT
jgi:hypothetical protein